ncbi:hypothetical protein OYC64_000032 [Pagothenia borchgrevinki]|uniref:Uncharacterized protein n=1 Tax=Pagothenia borchgrevinki TaxID=8213 RepID=A0ABD2HC46_PAGBO
MEAHKRNIFHDREAVFNGFLEPIPPTTAVVEENGQPQFCEQICQLPVPTPRSICKCSDDVSYFLEAYFCGHHQRMIQCLLASEILSILLCRMDS